MRASDEFKGLRHRQSRMTTASSARFIALVLGFLLLAMPFAAVSADTVIRADPIDLLPAGDFSDDSEWTLTTKSGYTENPADYTVAMIADGHLSFTHTRPQNSVYTTVWSEYSSTESNASIGEPDGGYTWSKGPNITVSDFDLSAVSDNTLLNVSLTLSFKIPDSLQQDSVRIIVINGGQHLLVKEYSHTFGEVDYMSGNSLQLSLDNEATWDWATLSALQVTVDYVSVGEFDDTEVDVDAIGLKVRHTESWFSFETAKAEHSVIVEDSPIINLDLNQGSHSSEITIAPCGLDAGSGSTPGTWTSAAISLPYNQSWGRFHQTNDGNVTWKLETSDDLTTWIDAGSLVEETLLPDSPHLRFVATVWDRCLTSVWVDINDPTVTVTGTISGSVDGLIPSLSTVRVAMNGALLGEVPVSPGPFAISAPIGVVLPIDGGDIDIGVSVRYQWSSAGEPESTVVVVDQIVMTGGYVIDWDLDPICEVPGSMAFTEDGGGVLHPFLSTCSDDITGNSDLVVLASSSNPAVLSAEMDGSAIRLQPMPDASGTAEVTIIVTDGQANSWTDTFSISISPVDDSPIFDPLPVDVTVEVGQTLSLALSYSDVDTADHALMLSTDRSWATFASGQLLLSPVDVGEQTVTVTISDGVSSVSHTVRVDATADADLFVESVTIRDTSLVDDVIEDGDIAEIEVFVRNIGRATAQPVNIRCEVDGELVGSTDIAVVPPGALASGICDWVVTTGGAKNVTISVEIDRQGDIDETSEENNIWVGELHVASGALDTSEGEQEQSPSNGGFSRLVMWGLLLVVIVAGIVLLQLAPGRIRRVQ